MASSNAGSHAAGAKRGKHVVLFQVRANILPNLSPLPFKARESILRNLAALPLSPRESTVPLQTEANAVITPLQEVWKQDKCVMGMASENGWQRHFPSASKDPPHTSFQEDWGQVCAGNGE